MSDANLIAGLEAAVNAQPDNVELRLQLISVLARCEYHVQALEHARSGLLRSPGHIGLLRAAAAEAQAMGSDSEAAHYRSMADVSANDAYVRVSADDAGDTTVPISEPAGRWITLADVAGLDDVKAQLERSFLAPIRHPELRAAFLKSLRGGMLLWGPPGCGKTHIARALAGELSTDFVAVGADDILSHWLGGSERNIAGTFAEARRRVPCVLFFDEFDALGRRRSSLSNDAMRTIVNQLLDELDGMNADLNEGVFVIGATNAPWDIDTALRRPGRLDRTIFVPPPDAEARIAILGLQLRDRPVASDVDLRRLADKTYGRSGADIAHIVDTAVDYAFEESVAQRHVVAINQSHLERALAETSSSVTAWLASARTAANYTADDAMFAPFHAWSRQNPRI